MKHHNMIETQHLINETALEKVHSIIEQQRVCLMHTSLNKTPYKSSPMTALELDDDGVIWFYTDIFSEKNNEIRVHDQMLLNFIDTDKNTYLSLYGYGFISTLQTKIDALWSPLAKAWFEDSDDPRIALIGFKILEGEFHELDDSQFTAMAKITVSTLFNTNNNLDTTNSTLKIN